MANSDAMPDLDEVVAEGPSGPVESARRNKTSVHDVRNRIARCRRAIGLLEQEIDLLKGAENCLVRLEDMKRAEGHGPYDLANNLYDLANNAFRDAAIEEAPSPKTALGTFHPCTSLIIDEEARTIDLVTDPDAVPYSEWIEGEGADICLHRDMTTKKVIGAHLELKVNRLAVFHSGPIRINAGFRKDENLDAD